MIIEMSSNHQQKPHKMCKSPPKPPKTAKSLPELGYEILNTNCTMVGSNNLTLDSKLNSSISYPNPQIKVCSKPMKSPDNLLKKPQSPRGDYIVQNSQKFANFNQLRNLQPSPTPNTSGFVQQTVRTCQSAGFNNGLGMSPSPSAYSNPSPSYPNASVSPFSVQISSPANSVSSITSGAIKSPVPSPQNIRPPTPQPILPQAFQQLPSLSGQNLVQIIHAPSATGPSYANHPLVAQRTIIGSQPAPQQPQLSGAAPMLKIKPPQNILPKPPASGGPTKQPGARTAGHSGTQGPAGQLQGAPPPQTGMGQLMLPGQAMGGPALLLNQVPLIVGSGNIPGSGGVQLILRPGTPGTATAGGKLTGGAQGGPQLVLQPGSAPQGPQVILQQPGQPQQRATAQHAQHLHQPQQLVRVLTANGMIQSLNSLGPLNALGPTYIMQQPSVQSLAQPQPVSQVQSLAQTSTTVVTSKPQQTFIHGTVPHQPGTVPHQSATVHQVQQVVQSVEQLPPPKKKPKKKKKNKEPKMDLANIMKLSGIGDEDDVLFESDTSESNISTEPTPTNLQSQKLPRPADSPHQHTDTNTLTPDFPKRIGNIHISALGQENHKQTRTESILTEKQTFGQSQISVQQSLSDINAINQNLAQIGLINHQNQNFITNNQILSQNFPSNSSENLANILQALNSGQNFSLLNGSVSQSTSIPGLTTFQNTQTGLPTSSYQKFPILPNTSLSMAQTLTNSDGILSGLKPQPSGNFQPKPTSSVTNPIMQNITNAHFNIPNIPNIQVQNFCGNNSNLILNQLNQGANLLAPNIPNFSGNITINNSLIPNTNLTLPSNIMPNFLPANLAANLVQPAQEMNASFGGNMQRTGGFKLALSEDGRLILQHDPTLNQDIQSQLLLQSIFGINLQGGNLVLTSVNNTPSLPPPPKPVTISEPIKKPPQPQPLDQATTKTTNIIQNAIPSIKTESQPPPAPVGAVQPVQQTMNPEPLPSQPPPNNYSYIVNLTPDQLETLKRNGQLTVNGQTIFMHRPNVANKEDKNVTKSPKGKTPKKKFENKNAKTVLQEHLNIKNQNIDNNQQINKVSTSVQSVQTSIANQTIINSLQSPIGKNLIQNQNIISSANITNSTSESIYSQNSQNIICIQSNSNKNIQTHNKINENHVQQLLQKQNIMKQSPNGEQLIILQQQSIDHKQNTHVLQQLKEPTKSEPEMIYTSASQHVPDKQMQFINGIDSNPMNVEQFLTNLNINPTNLGQLISQKLSQELPSGIDPKIVNISPGPTAGHIVAKIDISSDNMQQILNNSGPSNIENPPASVGGNTEVGNLVLPPLISMGVKQDTADVFNTGNGQVSENPSQQPLQSQLQPLPPLQSQVQSQPQPPIIPQPSVQSQPQILPQQQQIQSQTQVQQQQQLPALIIGGSVLNSSGELPALGSGSSSAPQGQSTPGDKVYQRVQTIQLTPQKQQLLKSVQLQIHALSARLQQKPADGSNSSNDQPEIHTALRHLFLEQQKILATGKVIPNITQPIANITNTSSTMESIATQAVPTTSASKTNGTFLTSLLQQPVVSHNQAQKVYYHHGNQIIAINPQLQTSFSSLPTSVGSVCSLTPTPVSATLSLPTLTPTTLSSSGTQTIPTPVVANKLTNNKKISPVVQNIQITASNASKLSQMTSSQHGGEVQSGKEATTLQVQSAAATSTVGTQVGVETQKMAAGAQVTPSKRVFKPSYSKAQLKIDYSATNQISPSENMPTNYKNSRRIEQQLQTDQNGAMNPDITTPFSSKADAIKRLVRYHCYKQPVLSPKDLSKADEIFEVTSRHFIDKFRCMINKYQSLLLKESMREVQTSELMMVDRMFLAEEQLAYMQLQTNVKLQNELEMCEGALDPTVQPLASASQSTHYTPQIKTEVADPTGSETFEEDNRTNTDFNIKCGLNYFSEESCDSNNFQPEFDEFIGLEKNQEKPKNVQKNMESYNTTKIIGNFEIEINNKSCNSQESFTKNFRQKVEKNENFTQKDEDYDEWLCIQRELGYFPENKGDNDLKSTESPGDHSNLHNSAPDSKNKEKSGHKRSASDRNCLESLKKYRVEKHNSKVKKTGSIIGEVKFEVRIEHKKVFPEQKQMKTEPPGDKQAPIKRSQCFETSDVYPKRTKQMPAELIKQEDEFPELGETSDSHETFDRSIDEQVQSAIDSILNLQQITSMTEKQPDSAATDGGGTKAGVLCSKKDDLFPGSNPEDTLDEAVKSILS